MCRMLRVKILVPLRTHMHDVVEGSKEKKVRVFLAVAIVKVVKKLPIENFNYEYPRVINNIC